MMEFSSGSSGTKLVKGGPKSSFRAERWLYSGIAFTIGLLVAVLFEPALSPRLAFAKQSDDVKPPASTRVEVTRADLAASYLRLEQAYFAKPIDELLRSEINRKFDQATMAFFMGRSGDALRTINDLTAKLLPDAATPAGRATMSLKVTVDPPVWIDTQPVDAVARIRSMYALSLEAMTVVDLQLRLVDTAGKTVFEHDFSPTVGQHTMVEMDIPLNLGKDSLLPGQYSLQLMSTETASLNITNVCVVTERSLSEQQFENDQQLSVLEFSAPPLKQALASCRARNRLLNDRPSDSNSAEFLADLNALAKLVATEITALQSDQDPYRRRVGDYWRVLAEGESEIPLRVYAPSEAAQDEPLPLLIVLHGAGGDENMFMEAYGAGAIRDIAERKGVLIASPLTYSFGSNPRNFDLLVEVLETNYAIDKERIYLLGHSMGSNAVSGLARSRCAKLAAVCTIAGGRFSGDAKLPPSLAIVAELDGVVPARSILSSVEKAIADNQPIELRLMQGYGHTLVVGEVLSDAVDWLLQHSAPSTPEQ